MLIKVNYYLSYSRLIVFFTILLFFANCKKDDDYNRFGQYNSIIFNPSLSYGSMQDNDGNTYKTIQIGNQVWMAENLKTSKYNDGTAIPFISSNNEWINCGEAYCWFNDDPSFKNVYGALYSPGAVLTGKLAPTGWHIPNDNEWDTLRAYAGGEYNAGYYLKEVGVTHWDWSAKYGYTSTHEASNKYGFTALPGGIRSPGDGFCLWVLSEGNWWSHNTDDQGDYLSIWTMHEDDYFFDQQYIYLSFGISVRCIKDN